MGDEKSVEEKIIACADAMDHIERSLHMFYRLIKFKKYDYEKSREWLKSKMERGWKKLELKAAKDLMRKKYKATMTLLE